MKKVLFSVLVILLVAGCAVFLFPGKTGSDQYVSGDYRFTILGDDTVAVPRYSGKAVVVSVPDTLDNRRVTAIGDSAFSLCLNIKEVNIPDGVVRIGKNAFACCPFLVSVTLPDSLESIGENAFDCCDSLESLTIPDRVTEIGESAFIYCDSLSSVTLPSGLTRIREQTFFGCASLDHVTIPDRVTEIGTSAFYNCTSLTDIRIPDSVASIGQCAFFGCSRLASVTIPDSVTVIKGNPFIRFKNIFDLVKELKDKTFAVIIDEAHSSTAGPWMLSGSPKACEASGGTRSPAAVP